jgi:hypothetical protein
MLLGVVCLCVSLSGCSLFVTGTHNIGYELSYCAHNVFERGEYRKLAKSAFAAMAAENPGEVFTHEFRCGFLDGYVDYLYSGGCEPSLPARFLHTKYQTPAKLRAAEEWMAGFREGVAWAKASGYREQIVYPLGFFCPGYGHAHIGAEPNDPLPGHPVPGPKLIPDEPTSGDRKKVQATPKPKLDAGPAPVLHKVEPQAPGVNSLLQSTKEPQPRKDAPPR